MKYIILGIIQGFTEFFPVSSSAHLVIMQKLLGISQGELLIATVLHLGTALALVVFFFRDIIELIYNKKLLLYILLVSVITGIIGITGKDFFENLFKSPKLAAIALLITGTILLITRTYMHNRRNVLNIKDAFVLGLAQSFAIIPGISRSGATISSLLFRGIGRNLSFKFSFLASIPAVLGAFLLQAKEIDFAQKTELHSLFTGFIFSFLSGIFALWALNRILAKAKLYYFGYYCITIAVFTLLFMT